MTPSCIGSCSCALTQATELETKFDDKSTKGLKIKSDSEKLIKTDMGGKYMMCVMMIYFMIYIMMICFIYIYEVGDTPHEILSDKRQRGFLPDIAL